MTVIEAVREIIKRCPYLDEYYKSLGIDRLGKDSTSYSIESVLKTTDIEKRHCWEYHPAVSF